MRVTIAARRTRDDEVRRASRSFSTVLRARTRRILTLGSRTSRTRGHLIPKLSTPRCRRRRIDVRKVIEKRGRARRLYQTTPMRKSAGGDDLAAQLLLVLVRPLAMMPSLVKPYACNQNATTPCLSWAHNCVITRWRHLRPSAAPASAAAKEIETLQAGRKTDADSTRPRRWREQPVAQLSG